MPNSQMLMPVLCVPHGGGPLPLLGESSHDDIAAFLKRIGASIPKPQAVLVISAHWETDVPTVLEAATPSLLFDYYGFPPEAYQFRYPVKGASNIAYQVKALLMAEFGRCEVETERGLDHGVFVPMMLMYPNADVPIVQISVLSSLDPLEHIRMGKCLQTLRSSGVLILGSGNSFHNMRDMMSGVANKHSAALAREFDHWLVDTMTNSDYDSNEREARLTAWDTAPAARFSHPREEHLLPMHVCAGAASMKAANLTFHEPVLGRQVSGYIWR